MSLVSIIIPSYNYGWVLAETLDSLLAQTYPDWEAIVVDDGSADDTRAVADRYVQQDKRIRYVHQANAGLSAARNTGIALAQGDYVQLLDADDLLAPEKLATQVAFLAANPAVDVVYGDVRYFLHGHPAQTSRSLDMLDQEWMKPVPETGDGLLNALAHGNIMVVNAPLIRTALLRRLGVFNPALRSLEDWEYWLRCALAGARLHYQPGPATEARVRVHATSMSQNVPRMLTAILQVRETLAQWLAAKNATQAQRINAAEMVSCHAALARHNLSEGSVWAGVRGFVTAAQRSGRYGYYLKSIPFWLRKRILASWNKP